MVKLSSAETMSLMAIQQLIHEWACDLDDHNGLNIGDLVTEDCIYVLGDMIRNGRAAVEKHYRDRLDRLTNEVDGVPLQRHLVINLHADFESADLAAVTFRLLFFSTVTPEPTDPLAIADVWMTCRRDADEHWRIARFDSNQTFRRPLT